MIWLQQLGSPYSAMNYEENIQKLQTSSLRGIRTDQKQGVESVQDQN